MSAATGDILISDGGVEIAKSNVLRYVRTDNQSGTEQTLNNRLLTNMTIPNTSMDWNYFQKFKIADLIPTQIIIDVSEVTAIDSFKVYDFEDDSLKATITIPAVTLTKDDVTYGTVNWYDFIINTSGYNGYYYVIVTINTTQLYQSEPFNVFAFTDDDGILLKWYNNIISRYNDGIYYDGTQLNIMRLESRFFHIEPGQEKTVYKGLLGRINILKGQPLMFIMLQLSGVPYWIFEKINIALQHDNFFINNEEFQTDEKFSIKHIKQGEQGTLITTGEVKLQQVNYEEYTEFEEAAAVVTDYVRTKRGLLRTKRGIVKHK